MLRIRLLESVNLLQIPFDGFPQLFVLFPYFILFHRNITKYNSYQIFKTELNYYYIITNLCYVKKFQSRLKIDNFLVYYQLKIQSIIHETKTAKYLYMKRGD